jgi:hypothetical protein
MFIYWVLFLIPAIGTVTKVKFDRQAKNIGWYLLATVYVFFIGFRFQVGIDWFNLLVQLGEGVSDGGLTHKSIDMPLQINKQEVGISLIIWASAKIGVGIYGVNLAGATVLMIGLIVFCRRQPAPFLALVVAIPFLVIVIGMGYTRQAMAIGFLLLAIISLSDGRLLHFSFMIALGALFHATVILFMPLALSAFKVKSIWKLKYLWTLIWLSFIGTLLFYSLLVEYLADLRNYYFGIKMSSGGSYIRAIMNVIPAITFLVLRKRFNLDLLELRLWTLMSIFCVLLFPLIEILPSSSAVDRVGWYFIPIQLFVYSRLPLFFQRKVSRTVVTLTIITVYAFVQFTFLNFGSHAHGWIPYKNYLWEII